MEQKISKTTCLFFFLTLAISLVMIRPAQAAGQVTKEKKPVVIEKERSEFKTLIEKNKNYFGTFPGLKIKPVFPMNKNTKYEEIRCLGYLPEDDLLQAVVSVKLPYGYKGDLCSTGSMEYVRFFIDWNGNGAYEAAEDVGLVSVNVHDIADTLGQCLNKTKPLSYAASLKLDPKKMSCKYPNLVKARAILSWDHVPTPGDPDFPPVWGNVVDRWIQIEPLWLLAAKVAKKAYLKDMKIDLDKLKIEKTGEIPIVMTPAEMRELYKGKNIPELRFNLAELHSLADKVKLEPAVLDKYKKDPQKAQLAADIDAILKPNPSVKYEELGCVGLQYDLEQLVATLKVKLPNGYCGGLCHAGSAEYVGFWSYELDKIEQVCYWKYLGTARVGVHDIDTIPAEGLNYAVVLPTDFSRLRQACEKPSVVRIRAILSWNKPPDNPEFKPVWGNKVETLIQIGPIPPGQTGKQVPFISQVGGMPVAGIDGNSKTVMTSTLGEGYANGPSIPGSFTANESPFGGLITINGRISFPPDDPPSDNAKLKYRMQYKKNASGNWKDIENDFWIVLNTTTDGGVNWVQSYKKQSVDNGYYLFHADWEGDNKCVVEGEVLGQWWTPVFEGDGLYVVRALLYSPGAPADPAHEVPAAHVSSNEIKIMVDNKAPDVSLTVDLPPGTNCGKFPQGTKVTGTFSATDKHFSVYGFSLLPTGFPAGSFFLTSPSPAVPIELAVTTYPTIAAPGVAAGTFELDTTNLTPCGYVIYLEAWDRTIVNNYWSGSLYGNRTPTSAGLCVVEKK